MAWFETRTRTLFLRRLMALAAFAGAVTALAQAPFNLWPLGPVGLALLFALFRVARRPWRAFALGWAGGAGYFAASLHWIVEPFLVDAARHGWMAPFALLFMAAGLALFWGAASALAFRLGARPLTWIVALTLAEYARSHVFTGFPWSLIGYGWAASPAAIYAAWVGPHGLTAAALAVAVTLWRLFTPARARAWPMLGLYALLIGAGVWLGRSVPPATDAPLVRLVQPNAAQHLKWDRDYIQLFFARQLDYTSRNPGPPRPDLIVWPETAIPWALGNAAEPLRMIAAEAAGVPVVLGLRRHEGLRLMNALTVLGADGQPGAIYDKSHLVPFGEYIPFGDLAARFGIHGLAAGQGFGFSPGPGPALIDLPGIGPARPLICYEAVFPHEIATATRPRLLMLLTNDAWFGRFSGPYQHLQQARMRAIEQGLPMLRAANTGISAMIGPHGHVTASLALNRAGFIDARLPPALPPTPYSRYGDWPLALLLVAALVLARLRRPAAVSG